MGVEKGMMVPDKDRAPFLSSQTGDSWCIITGMGPSLRTMRHTPQLTGKADSF